MVQQDPEYLRNQSRQFHKRYRRNRAFAKVWALLWIGLFTLLFLVAALDRIGGMRWGLAGDMWDFLASVGFGILLWCLMTMIRKIMLAYVRHTYGPEPID